MLTTRLFRPAMRQLSPLRIRPILASHPSPRLFHERSPAPSFGVREAAARHRRFDASSGDVSRGMAMTPAKLAPEACQSACDSVGNKEGHEQSENEASNAEILFNVLAITLGSALFAIYLGYLGQGVLWVLRGFPTSTPDDSRPVNAEQAAWMAEQRVAHITWWLARELLEVRRLKGEGRRPGQHWRLMKYELDKAKRSLEEIIAEVKED
ncbi:hypothetical protein LTS10_007198 [Elasticomyces elasticus]|nr:hypothetical protein LTS10_007198 [Elasticomyces elasticus]